MFNNPKGSKIVIPKGSIGQTIEDIEMISKPKYCVSDNIAFIETLLNNDEEFNQIFHINEQTKIQLIHKNDPPELPNSKLKKKTKNKSKQNELDYTNNYELETDFSEELKELEPVAGLHFEIDLTESQIK